MTAVIGSNDLHITKEMILQQQWEDIIAVCAQNPACAQKLYTGSSSFPLHEICTNRDAPVEAVEALLDAHPDAALAYDESGVMPLHLACQSGASPQVLNQLVKQYPETVFEVSKPPITDVNGMTPVRLLWDHACQNNEDTSFRDDYNHVEVWPAMQVLLEAAACFWSTMSISTQFNDNPRKNRNKKRRRRRDTVESRNVSSLCCLHAAVALHAIDAPIELLHYALQRYPEQVDLVDSQHRLPLHIAVTSRGMSQAIDVLLGVNPEAAGSMDPNEQLYQPTTLRRGRRQNSSSSFGSATSIGSFSVQGNRYPLHSALANGHTWRGGVQDLADNCSEAVVCPDSFTSLYPYQLAAIAEKGSCADLETIYGLLRAEPGVLMADDDQETGLGILLLQSDHEHSISSEAILCLTSDDESVTEAHDLPVAQRKAGLYVVDEVAEDASLSLRISNHELSRRSFVSFDDQAQILEKASAVYQKRKESGFKDLGLMKHIDDCVQTRASLREVGDPEILRKKKIADFIEEFRRTKPRGKHTHGLSEVEVKERRASLKRVSETEKGIGNKSINQSPPSSPISSMRSRLRSANSPRKIPDSPASPKKWTPRSPPTEPPSSIASPLNFMFGGMKKPSQKQALHDRSPSPSRNVCALEKQSTIVPENTVLEDDANVVQSGIVESENVIGHSTLSDESSRAVSNACIGESPELPVKLKPVTRKPDVEPADSTSDEKGPMSPLQVQKSKLRSISSRTRDSCTNHVKDKEIPQSPLNEQEPKLPIQLKRVSQTTQNSCSDETPEEMIAMSPLQVQRSKLRSAQPGSTATSTTALASKAKTEDEEVLSPYQAQRQKLRMTKTKPRSYKCSILLVSKGEDGIQRPEHLSTIPSSDENNDNSDSKNEYTLLEDKTYESSSVVHTPPPPRKKPVRASSSSTLVVEQKVPLLDGDELSQKELGDCRPQTVGPLSTQFPIASEDQTKSSLELSVASVDNLEMHAKAQESPLIEDSEKCEVEVSVDESEDEQGSEDSEQLQGLGHALAKVPEQPEKCSEVQSRPNNALEPKPGPEMIGKGVVVAQQEDQKCNQHIEAPKRAVPARRISSEHVLWKRAEMEIRNQVNRAHDRLERYREQCRKCRERQAMEREEMSKKFALIESKLAQVKKGDEGIAISMQEYAEIMLEHRNESCDIDENETQNETQVLVQTHFLIALERQQELEKADGSAIKTYLLRCKEWLQDYESVQKHMRDLRVQNLALRTSYKSIIQKQEALIESCHNQTPAIDDQRLG